MPQDTSWKVGTNGLGTYHVVRKTPYGGLSAHDWVRTGRFVRQFRLEHRAQKLADALNASDLRVAEMLQMERALTDT